MIRVTIGRKSQSSNAYANESNPSAVMRLCQLYASGHAGWDSAGKDVLCAAVSVLCENLAHSLQVFLPLPNKHETSDKDTKTKHKTVPTLLAYNKAKEAYALI